MPTGFSCCLQGLFVSNADFFKTHLLGQSEESNTNMMIQKGRGTYVYSTQRVNGKPVTRYIGKNSSPQAKEYATRKEEKKQQRNREQELERLNQELEGALKLIK